MKIIAVLLCALFVALAGVARAEEAAEGKSQAITSVSYDADAKSLTVAFERGTYVYSDVPAEVADALQKSESQGAYYNEHIKGKYTSSKQDE